ncbi:hypothetical protein [Pedobacter sp. UYP1]|uniref:hypothetical protein n=1 Tax=Pedobacter sp. UYP1 TaxID=1756396 RepID=UPI003390873A
MKQSVARNGKKDFSYTPGLFVVQECMLSFYKPCFGQRSVKNDLTSYLQLFEKAI